MLQLSKIFLLSLLIAVSTGGFSQACTFTLQGKVLDSKSRAPLEIVNLYIQELESGTTTDINGEFKLENLCKGSYHLVISHIGCETKEVFIKISQDTTVIFEMDHSTHVLHEIVFESSKDAATTQKSESIKSQYISDHGNDNLSTIISTLPGVNTLKNGSGIAKPIVHGLFGNRLSILNNGVAQSGQQWGNDHSPEIDPLAANQIKVVKGASTIEYMGSNLGSVILVEPQKISNDPHLHGKTSYLFNTNGRGHSVNANFQKYSSKLAWQVNGTFKKSGDSQTPNYYLNNSGIREANLAIQLEKHFSERFKTEVYLSTFNSTLGILRGAHVGNLADLSEAFARKVPFFTEEKFSYKIDAPRQKVGHHFAKVHSTYFIDDTQWLDITIASQVNDRKEFDVRRSGRSEIPALSLIQYSQFGELKYQHELLNNWKVNTGLQVNILDNTNRPETGILPLIPDYRSYESGAYVLINKRVKASFFEGGLRCGRVAITALTITDTTPRKIERYDAKYNNISSSLGWTYALAHHYSLALNMGYGSRNPAVNELYSRGLHQGVSGIEEGDVNLISEKALKTTLGLKGEIHEQVTFEVLGYYQKFQDYIYLQPTDEQRLTIRGAFPVFKYRQDDATIAGLDVLGSWNITKFIQFSSKYSFLRGNNTSLDIPLVYMPSNNLLTKLSYEYPKAVRWFGGMLNNIKAELGNQVVFKQNHLLPSQDFVNAPAGYQLFDVNVAANIQMKHARMRLIVKAENILNTSYRDYLNRQRYFADDLGRSIIVGITVSF